MNGWIRPIFTMVGKSLDQFPLSCKKPQRSLAVISRLSKQERRSGIPGGGIRMIPKGVMKL